MLTTVATCRNNLALSIKVYVTDNISMSQCWDSLHSFNGASSCLTFSNAHCKPKCRLEMNTLFLDNLLFNRSILAGLYMFIGPSTIKWPDPFVRIYFVHDLVILIQTLDMDIIFF